MDLERGRVLVDEARRNRLGGGDGVPTRSLGENRYLLEYRFVWYDKSGLEVRPAMGWKEFVLEPKGSKVIQANALDKTAVDWKVEIRWANR